MCSSRLIKQSTPKKNECTVPMSTYLCESFIRPFEVSYTFFLGKFSAAHGRHFD